MKLSLRLSLAATTTDDEILSAIDAATEHVEHRLDRVLCSQTFELTSDRFPPGAIQLAQEPIDSITSIEYTDTDGADQTVPDTDYALNKANRQIYRTVDTAWPTTSGRQRSVRVTYVAGYGTAADVPKVLKRLIFQLTGRFFYDPAMEDKATSDFIDRMVAGYVRTGVE